MRASRTLAVTAAAFATIGLAAPMAAAGGSGRGPTNVTVNPSSVHQGATMQVSAEGCGRAGGSVSSNAFPTVRLSEGRTGFATARIRDNATPGQYNLSVRCNDSDVIATHRFTVLAGQGAQGGLGGSMGPSSVEMQIGGGLVAASAIGGAVFIVRRRRTGHAAI